jgi:phage tail sheath gpL-like
MPSTWRVPFFYAQVDATKAGTGTTTQRSLIISQQSAAATATADTPVQCFTEDDAATLFGRGSYCHAMVKAYRENDPFGELWVLPIADKVAVPAGVDNTHDLLVGGPATANGTLVVYVGGYRVTVAVTNGDAANTIATNLSAAINAAALEWPITVVASVAIPPTVVLTSINAGLAGNDLDVRVNYRGAINGEELPAGVTCGVTNNATGANDPALTTALANLGDDEYDFVMHTFNDTTGMDAIEAVFEDTLGRWAPDRQIYGHAFTSDVGTQPALVIVGAARNDQHHTIFGYNDSPSSPWEWTAAHVGQIAQSAKKLASQPYQTLVPEGLLAPPRGVGRWTNLEKQTLLENGISVSSVGSDGFSVVIDRVITNYLTAPGGTVDDSYLDVTTMYTLMTIMRRLRAVIEADFGRHVLMNDGSRFGAGLPVVTPRLARARIIAEYESCIFDALCENLEAFTEHLVVERSSTDPNRIEVLYPPDLANQLRIFDVLAQFRLQYATAAQP